MKKETILSHKKFISGVLLAAVAIGSLAALLAISWPFLGLATLKFIDGAPDTLTITDYFIKFVAYLMPIVPWALALGGMSAILYTFIMNDSENKIFLRIWGTVLLGVLLLYLYPYIQVYFR